MWGKTKTGKYLLITHSFPHSPQTFPQELSTPLFGCGYSFLVHIKFTVAPAMHPHFFAGGGFYHGEIFVQKFGLDSGCPPAGNASLERCVPSFSKPARQRERTPNFRPVFLIRKKVKKGVDFVLQTRYNVCLYGKLEEGGALNGKYQVL